MAIKLPKWQAYGAWVGVLTVIYFTVQFFSSTAFEQILKSEQYIVCSYTVSAALVFVNIINKIQKKEGRKEYGNMMARMQGLGDIISGGLALPCLFIFRDSILATMGCDVPMKQIGALEYGTCGLLAFILLSYAIQEGLTSVLEFHGYDKGIKAGEIKVADESLEK